MRTSNHLTAAALVAGGLLWLPGARGADADALVLGASARSALGITVYNDGQALVRDTRRATLARGVQRVEFREVAATIQPETVALKSVSGGDFSLLEQNFDFDLLTPEALLAKYVGRKVTVIRTNPATGAQTSETADVLAANSGVVLRYADRIETGVAGRLSFASVPPNLRDRPTLSMLLEAAAPGPRQLELMYLAGHITWKADYIASLRADGARMTLDGWVTLTNQSGAAFDDARLQLVAGTLNRVPRRAYLGAAMPAPAFARNAVAMAEEKLADYHLYSLPRPTTIADNQTKQLALLSASDVPVTREYVLQGESDYWYLARRTEAQKGLKPSVFLRFENRGGDLGIPLPAGIVRAYLPDSNGAAQLIGEDAIAHTAKGETVSLRMGEAFDITADRTQTDFRTLGEHARQSSYRIELRNAGAQPVTVIVRELLHGDWRITAESLEHVKESAAGVAWHVAVPAAGGKTLEYTAITTW